MAFLEYPAILAFANAEIAAFLQFRNVPANDAEILQLFTQPLYRQQGIARALLRCLVQQIRRGKTPAAVYLEVRESNAAARQLYTSEGFIPLGLRRSYYSDPDEDAIVLSMNVC